MTYENILLEKKNSIAYVTVNRPKVLNALNWPPWKSCARRSPTSKTTPAFRVAILTGAGEKAFIAGADISELAKHEPGQRQGIHPSRPVGLDLSKIWASR